MTFGLLKFDVTIFCKYFDLHYVATSLQISIILLCPVHLTSFGYN